MRFVLLVVGGVCVVAVVVMLVVWLWPSDRSGPPDYEKGGTSSSQCSLPVAERQGGWFCPSADAAP